MEPQRNNAVRAEWGLLHQPGPNVPVLANQQIIDQAGQPVSLLISLMDIQQRIQAEQQIRASIEMLLWTLSGCKIKAGRFRKSVTPAPLQGRRHPTCPFGQYPFGYPKRARSGSPTPLREPEAGAGREYEAPDGAPGGGHRLQYGIKRGKWQAVNSHGEAVEMRRGKVMPKNEVLGCGQHLVFYLLFSPCYQCGTGVPSTR